MFIHKYFYKFLSLISFCYYFLTSNVWNSLLYSFNPFKLNKNLSSDIVNNKSTLFLTLFNTWKKPNHLVLIIGEDIVLYNDIIQIILWCMVAGISFVSVYDYKDRLSHYSLLKAIKNNPLFEEIDKLKLGFTFDDFLKKSLKFETLKCNRVSNGGVTNGISATKYYASETCNCLNEDSKKKHTDCNMNNKHSTMYKNGINGKTHKEMHSNGVINSNGHVAKMEKMYSNGVINSNGNVAKIEKLYEALHLNSSPVSTKTELNIITRKKIEADLLNTILELSSTNVEISDKVMQEALHSKCPVPDPEVAIVIGNKLSTYGLMPWSIRLTEFFQFNNYYDISLSKFENILRKFSKCEQRYGK